MLKMPQENLKNKTIKGLAWSTIDNFVSLGITFVLGIILARLLTPKDYGTIALLTIFIAVSNVFINSGFSSALIRKPDLNEIDKSTTFYFNVIVGFGAYVILFILAPVVSWFYDLPVLTSLMRVIGITLIFSSFAIVQQTELSIKIDFKSQAMVSAFSAMTSGFIGIYFAYHGYGVWALAIQQVSSGFFRTLLLWLIVSWYPKEKFSMESFRYLWGFGSKMLASGLLDQIWVNVYPIVIGKVFSPVELGLYSRAQHFAQLPSSNLTTVLQRVTFPVLSKIQNEEERLRSSYRKMLKMSAFIIFPLMMVLAGVASPLIKIILGDKWVGSVVFLQIICFAMMWYPIHAINLNLLEVKGRSDLFLKLEIIKKIVGVCILFLTIPLGLIIMCYGLILSSLISLIVNTYYTGKLIGVGLFCQIRDILPIFIISIIMFISILIINSVFINIWVELFLGVILGSTIFVLMAFIFKSRELQELINMVKR